MEEDLQEIRRRFQKRARRFAFTLHGPTSGFTDPGALTDPSRAAFAPYLRTPDVYNCPAERTFYSVGGRSVKKLRSYSMNDYLNGGPGQDDRHSPFQFVATEAPYKRNTQFRDTSQLFVFIDVEPMSICWTAFEIPPPLSSRTAWIHAPGTMHDKKASVLSYADGHAESHRWKKPLVRTVPTSTQGFTVLAMRVTPSPSQRVIRKTFYTFEREGIISSVLLTRKCCAQNDNGYLEDWENHLAVSSHQLSQGNGRISETFDRCSNFPEFKFIFFKNSKSG